MKYFFSHIVSSMSGEPEYKGINKLIDKYYNCLFWSEKAVDIFIDKLKNEITSFNDKNKKVQLSLAYGGIWEYSRIRIYYNEEDYKPHGITLCDICMSEVRGIYRSKQEAAV